MKLLFTSLCFLLSLSFAQASCELPKGEKITIGCTYKCDFATRSRLKIVGASLGYKLNFVDLSLNKDISESLSKVDTVLIPGGADIHPKFYLKDVSEDLRSYTEKNLHLVKFTEEGKRRDLFEYTLLKIYLSLGEKYSKLPVLGICRGMQMLSVAQGLPLYLDIATELGIPNRLYKFDKAIITENDSLMRSFYGDKDPKGFEMHHQGIRVDYFEAHKNDFPNVKVSSFSNQGKIAESIEYNDLTALGVQFHPEKSMPSTTRPIFKWYLTKACEYKSSSKGMK
jgi:gamma-glutamyl-gamma-aminobutyrate hydrolase PuuD